MFDEGENAYTQIKYPEIVLEHVNYTPKCTFHYGTKLE